MWKVLPKFGLIKFLAVIFAAIFLSALIYCFGDSVGFNLLLNKTNFIDSILISSTISFPFIVIIFIMAKYAWKPIWKAPLLGPICNKNVCPDLNGVWKGKIQSSYIGPDKRKIVKDVSMNISADFLGFDIKLISDDNYQRSTVVQSEIYKDPRDNNYYVSYIFESVVDQPLSSDDSKFDGAAKLSVRFEDDGLKLVGTYWTNRAYQRGLNTAGTIELIRINHSD
ncbi:TPA: hypothetical protein ACN36B_004904 [Vibrio parahaemolyticus]|uniref:hypothetical protein n=1 Tax=Vibrio parahaemolyticus TaxID=670 RepID=UPI002808417C|nr:hypothetical protein [Vibrio parahaemolyticus]ELB2059847.1 hypothetical protein [Vibrio parahaemolyticus]